MLNLWKSRSLTLIGKISIINTLVASLFVHKMQVLPAVPYKLVKTLDTLLTDFIWNGKRAKVSLKTLRKKKKCGGLNLVDIELRDIAIKCCWIQTLAKDKKGAELAFHLLAPLLQEDIFRCNIKASDVEELGIKSVFWSDVLKAWCKFNYKMSDTHEGQLLWFNSDVKIGGKMVFIRRSYAKGLKWVSQLYPNGRLLSVCQAFELYDLSLMEMHGLISAILRGWKQSVAKGEDIKNETSYDQYINKKGLCSLVYNTLRDSSTPNHLQVKWRRMTSCESVSDVKTHFTNIFKVTNVLKYRSFQFRMLHGALILNQHLFRWGMISSNACTFCEEEKETVQHLFVSCEKVKPLWKAVEEYVKRKSALTVVLSDENIFFNTITTPVKKFPNFLCLITKQYVYSKRCLKAALCVNELEIIFKNVESMEKFIALKNNNLTKHLLKWTNLETNSSPTSRNYTNYIYEYMESM